MHGSSCIVIHPYNRIDLALETFYAKNREEWRTWLHEHHAHAKEIWLIYYRKATGKPRVSYNTAVEEALCFGLDRQPAKGHR